MNLATLKDKNIVFFGATDTGYACLKAMLEVGVSVSAIVTERETFSISYSDTNVRNCRYVSFEDIATEYDIPLMVYSEEKNYLCEKIKKFTPLLIVSIGWFHMIPQRILNIPKLGTVLIHSSLLPKYRGGAPLVWAMINGERETGVTLFYLTDEVDAGDIICQKKITIDQRDYISDLIRKANSASVDMVKEYIPRVLLENAPRIKQDEKEATRYPQRRPEDGMINWSWSAEKIYNFIRAQSLPYPCAYTFMGRKVVRIVSADIADNNEGFRGIFGNIVKLNPDNSASVLTSDLKLLNIKKVIDDSRKVVSAKEYFKRIEIRLGFDPLQTVGDYKNLSS